MVLLMSAPPLLIPVPPMFKPVMPAAVALFKLWLFMSNTPPLFTVRVTPLKIEYPPVPPNLSVPPLFTVVAAPNVCTVEEETGFSQHPVVSTIVDGRPKRIVVPGAASSQRAGSVYIERAG